MHYEKLINSIEDVLMKEIKLIKKKYDPVIVKNTPKPWKCIGSGNFSAVFTHPEFEDLVVKIHNNGNDSLNNEAGIYKKLGKHPSFSELIHQGEGYIILKLLKGITLYDAVLSGVRIPESVINDITEALEHARRKGLTPCDVHGKNVIMEKGRGYVVDVSDFNFDKEDTTWDDLVKAYYKYYRKTLYKFPIKIPKFLMYIVRHSYRIFKIIK